MHWSTASVHLLSLAMCRLIVYHSQQQRFRSLDSISCHVGDLVKDEEEAGPVLLAHLRACNAPVCLGEVAVLVAYRMAGGHLTSCCRFVELKKIVVAVRRRSWWRCGEIDSSLSRDGAMTSDADAGHRLCQSAHLESMHEPNGDNDIPQSYTDTNLRSMSQYPSRTV